MTVGSSYPISVTNGMPYYGPDQCGIWVDWDQNGSFSDPGEMITVSGTPGVGPYTALITPPAYAVAGNTRMRVRIMYSGAVSPCGTTNYGEVEDYTITVMPSVATASVSIYCPTTDVCQNVNVTLFATPVNGGSNPSYQWKVNGINVGSNSNMYTYAPSNNDNVSCEMTSNLAGALNNPATSNNVNFLVRPLPGAIGSISGAITVCQGDNNVYYSIQQASDATYYIWNLPPGTTGNSGAYTAIYANYSMSAASGNIEVTGYNDCGSGPASTLSITVNSLPLSTSTIAGPSSVLKGQTALVYSIPSISNASAYIWTLPTGFNASITSNSIIVDISNQAVSGDITVQGQNSCGLGNILTKHIDVGSANTFTTNKLHLHAMLQCLYQSNGSMSYTMKYDNDIEDFVPNSYPLFYVDTLSVLIRSTKPPDYNILAEIHGIEIYPNGSISGITIPKIDSTNKFNYIVINHRNSIETWSDSTDFTFEHVNYNFFAHPFSFEFPMNMYPVYDNGNYQGNALWSGDINQDGTVNIFDLALVFDMLNDPNAPIGYVTEDINGDGTINIYDLAPVFDNMNLGVSTINPFTVKKK